jgi:hypothetical protein
MMSLHSRTIAKVFREHFTGDNLPVMKSPCEQKKLIALLKSQLEKTKGIIISVFYSHYDNDPDKVCRFEICDEKHDYYSRDIFSLKFNEHNELIIAHYSLEAIVYNLDQIYTFIDRLKEEYQKKKSRQLKREKINKLKKQAIVAKVKEIAKEDAFDFFVREYSIKLKLTVRIEGGKIVEFDIPYNQFQDILKELRSVIQDIRALQKSGINFKILNGAGKGYYAWITHDSL